MAAATIKSKYGQNAVYGSLAYDFNNPELTAEEYSTAATPKTRPQVQTRVQTRARAAVHTRQSIAPLSIVGILIAAFLFVITISAKAELIGISDSSVTLQRELDTLEEQQAKLRIRYESAFNMSDIEDYAIHSLGMQKPKADQIYYIDTSAQDKAVVIAQEESKGFVDSVSDMLIGIGEYLH